MATKNRKTLAEERVEQYEKGYAAGVTAGIKQAKALQKKSVPKKSTPKASGPSAAVQEATRMLEAFHSSRSTDLGWQAKNDVVCRRLGRILQTLKS
jgi:flagellar biosynthesis/type III secretory pathway protein FliH